MFEIVEDEQEVLVVKMAGKLVRDGILASISNPNFSANSGQHEFRIPDWRQTYEAHAIRKDIPELVPGGNRKARLADAARSRQRDEPVRLLIKRGNHHRDFVIAADDRGQCCRQIGQLAVENRHRDVAPM
jgi:hypothetical protein